MKEFFCVGTYTDPILFGTGEVFCGKGKGVYLCEIEEGKIEIVDQIPSCNPSFLCIDEKNKKIYAVNEKKEHEGEFGGSLTQFSYGDGVLRQEKVVKTGGTDPCHVALSPGGEFLSAANFASGSVTVFSLGDQGDLTGESHLFLHVGSGPHPVRQKGPHAHGTIFLEGEELMFVPDLGIDTVKAYGYSGGRVRPAPDYDFSTPPGSGPRIGEFARGGKYFYLINEISSQVMCFACERGKMKPIGLVETLPDGVDKTGNICSDLHVMPDGKYLYAANRGHDSLCCYRIEEEGMLTLVRRVPCGGKTPRNFVINPSGQYLLVGNQDSDTIARFVIEEDGGLAFAGVTEFPSPVCIRFFRKPPK